MNWITTLLNLCIVPFKDNNLFVGVAGILATAIVFRMVFYMIRK